MTPVRDPDFSGVGEAWRMEAGPQVTADHEAELATFVLRGPFHPFWSWWMIGLIHLRPIPTVKAPHKNYPDAEFELMILSIDPETPPNPDAPMPQSLKHLLPPDLVYQFHGVTDEQAKEICTTVVQTIINGRMSPDSDFRASWTSALDQTVEHYRRGIH